MITAMVTDHYGEGRRVHRSPRAPFLGHKNGLGGGIGHGMVTLEGLILQEV
jgi:hypothetical protein